MPESAFVDYFDRALLLGLLVDTQVYYTEVSSKIDEPETKDELPSKNFFNFVVLFDLVGLEVVKLFLRIVAYHFMFNFFSQVFKLPAYKDI